MIYVSIPGRENPADVLIHRTTKSDLQRILQWLPQGFVRRATHPRYHFVRSEGVVVVVVVSVCVCGVSVWWWCGLGRGVCGGGVVVVVVVGGCVVLVWCWCGGGLWFDFSELI